MLLYRLPFWSYLPGQVQKDRIEVCISHTCVSSQSAPLHLSTTNSQYPEDTVTRRLWWSCHFQNCHQPFFLISSSPGLSADALGELAYMASDYFQICHQRLVLRKLGLIAYNNKSIPTTSKTTLRTLMLCVFTIMASGPNCNHISQPPTIANIALTIKLIEIILLLPLTCFILDDLNEKVLDT